jgi:type IV pilus assembly protein PilF
MQRAKRKLLQALEQEPNSIPALDAMAYYLENTGDNKSAEEYYLRAIQVSAVDGKAHNNYGAFLCRNKRYIDADKQFMLAVQDPAYLNTAEAYENAGLCAEQIPDANKATAYFQKAIANDPSRAASYLELSQLTYNQSNFPLAQQYFDRYTALTKNMGPEGLWLGIRLARKLGDPTTAGNYSLQLQSKYPHSTEYQQLYASQINKPNNNDILKAVGF